MKKFRTFCSAAVLSAGLALSGCYVDVGDMRLETAKRIATPSFMLERQITADPFIITVYERVHDRGGPATIYIEGDGVAWASKNRPSLDPTPRNPVSLHMASRDNTQNVIYIARPCQYTKMNAAGPCDMAYWTSHRFSPETIGAMNATVDNIKAKYGLSEIHLVGFSGGATVAALLAEQRDDIVSLRTAAGNLDHKMLHSIHEVSDISATSLNPVDMAPSIAHIPQHHFVGEWDEVVPLSIAERWKRASGESSCIRISTVAETDHEEGWVNRWPVLLKAPLDCSKE